VTTFVVEFVSHCVRILIILVTTSSSYATRFGCNGNCILFTLIDKICIGDNPYGLCAYTYVHVTHDACQNSII